MPLEKIFKPKFSTNLIRLGKSYDGGYIVGKDSIKDTKTLISLGIHDDWSFEEDFYNYKDKKLVVKCYDNDTSTKWFLKRILGSISPLILIKKNFSFFVRSLKSYIKFRNISKNFSFIVKHLSYSDLDIILEEFSNNVFLKVDIDGWEYHILPDILNNQDKIDGLVIEFHNCDLHRKRIISFIEKLNLDLIHIHPNNGTPKDPNNDPTELEITFGKSCKNLNKKVSLPIEIDMPNNPELEDIKLVFK